MDPTHFDAVSFFGKEYLLQDERQGMADVMLRGVDFSHRFLRTVDDWNTSVDNAIQAEDNSHLKQLYEIEKIDKTRWPKRQAYALRIQAHMVQDAVKKIEKELQTT